MITGFIQLRIKEILSIMLQIMKHHLREQLILLHLYGGQKKREHSAYHSMTDLWEASM